MHDTMTYYPKQQALKNPPTALWQSHELEMLTHELEKLLAQNPDTFDDKNVRREIDVLERWREYYRRDLVTADAFSETSIIILANLRDRLKLVFDEIQRLEGEGGPPATKEQNEKNEALLKTIRRIDCIMTRNKTISH